jgi:Papain family cysteine protease
MAPTFGELTAALEDPALAWQADLRRPDGEEVPEFSLGASAEGLLRAEQVEALDLGGILDPGTNPFLAVRRVERQLVTPEAVRERISPRVLRRVGLDDALEDVEAGAAPPAGGVAAPAVDWRNRWGENWITSVRDQDPCNACWAFAGVALVEAMVRIECAIWTRFSEGDVHGGLAAYCSTSGNMYDVSNFFHANGFADLGSFPWRTDDSPYSPTPDRSGRSVRGPTFTLVGSVQDIKDWIDTVGPLITWLEVYQDFSGYSSGVYQRIDAPWNTLRGAHFMLVVGYDDALQAWLCKNSWGTAWGMSGYCWVRYGEVGIDQYAKNGLRQLNLDPWSKRRLHNGNLYESGNGSLHRNLETVGANGHRVLHHRRDGAPPFAWSTGSSFANDAAVCPTLIGTTFNRNMELVYLTTGNRLHHWFTGESGSGAWNDGGMFGPNDCQGVPGFVQGDYGAPGNFEGVVLVSGGQLQHVWRDDSFVWHNGPRFGNDLVLSGPTLVQGTLGDPHGNLECVAVRNDGTMQHFWRDEPTFAWNDGPVFGVGVSSPPVMIQGQYGMYDETGPPGNFELCVAAGGQVQHWWRDNAGDKEWRTSAPFGHDVQAVAGLCEGSWYRNLEIVVLRTDQQLQHYWRDPAGWHEGPIIGPA